MVVNLSMLDVNLCYNINACTNKNVTFWCLNWCLDLMPWFYVDFRDFYKCLSWCLPFCGRPLSVAWAKSMLCFANFILFIFYGRLMLRPRLTEVRETFTRGGPWVSIEKLLLGLFLVILKLQGGPKSDEIWHILRPRPLTFCCHARTRQNIVILKKMLSKDGCSTRCATFGELWPKNPWDPRATKFLKYDTRE